MAGWTNTLLESKSTLVCTEEETKTREAQAECMLSKHLVEGGPKTRTQVLSSYTQALLGLAKNGRTESSTREQKKSAGAVVSGGSTSINPKPLQTNLASLALGWGRLVIQAGP